LSWLRTPEAVRDRCHALLALAERDSLEHLIFVPERLDAAAEYVAAVTLENYPDLAVPWHSRWRHFEAGGVDRWRLLADRVGGIGIDELVRLRIDLCVVSVLLDAGAGAAWCFREADTGQVLRRSEGLAVASLHAFCSGAFSGDSAQPLRVDATGLARVSEPMLARAFQVSADNPLTGFPGRVQLLRNLGAAMRDRPDLFGTSVRPGGLWDYLRERSVNRAVSARDILLAGLEGLAPIWPGAPWVDGENLGDVWKHPAAGLVPFHKLSQWLAYSLFEPLEEGGLSVTDPDALTGLAEYRNGGLLLDSGVLRLRDPRLALAPLPVEHTAVVEWRGMTVALLDRLAPMVRSRLGLTAAELPLARVLQGGTWAAGRKIAKALRPNGEPPLQVISDGTVF
jgi:hypothetical protein